MKNYVIKVLICIIAFAGFSYDAYAADAYVECEQGTLCINGRIELGEQEHPVNITVTAFDSENKLNYIDIITAGTDGVAEFCYKNLGKSGDYTYVFDADTINITETVQLNGFIGYDYWDVFVKDMNELADKDDIVNFKNKFLLEKDNLSVNTDDYDVIQNKDAVFTVMLKDYKTYTTTDEIVKAFNRAVTLCDFNENKNVEKFMSIYNEDKENGYFGFADFLPAGTDGTIFDDLSDDIKKTVLAEYFKESFEQSSDMSEKFVSHVLFDTIKYADHFGTVRKVIEAYDEAEYISVVIDSSADNVCKKIINSDFKSFADVEKNYENFRKSLQSSNRPSSGGGGKTASSGLISGMAALPLNQTENTLQPTETNSSGNKPKMYFTDMEDAKWGLDAVNNLYENGIINGVGDNKFAPHKNVSRAEMAKLISLAAGYNPGTGVYFSDVDVNEWYYPYISAVCENTIFVGKSDDLFGVHDGITRQEAAVAIYRLVKTSLNKISENMTEESKEEISNIFEVDSDKEEYSDVYADNADVAAWAAEAVYALKAANVMSGRSGNTFAPNDTLTRVEAAVLCNSIYKYLKEGNV